MTALYYTLGVLIFVVAILASIGLHELGHMIPAKRFGGKVTQYFIGFGPTVWSRRIGETEYGLKAIPLGGYVKIIGMLPPGAEQLAETEVDADGTPVHRVRKSNTGMFTQLVSDARAAEWELVEPGDEDRLFYKLPWWKKVVVMAGGPSVNIAIAFLILWGLFATVGNSADPVTEPVVDEVSPCVVPYAESGRECTPKDERTPAAMAGFEPGDRFVSLNGRPVTTWEDLQARIRANGDRPVVFVMERDGRLLSIETTTTVAARPVSNTDETLVEVGFLGVVPVAYPTTGGPLYTLGQMGYMTVDVAQALATLPVKVFDVAKAVVGLQERDPESPVSIVGGGRIAGEVAAHEEFPVQDKALSLLGLVAMFNFFIGMFNFVPLLPLDGGHIAGALWEALRRGIARLRGRPDPGYVDVAKLLPVAYGVAACLVLMGLVLIVADLVVPIHLTT